MFETLKVMFILEMSIAEACVCGCGRTSWLRHNRYVALSAGCTVGVMNPSEWVDEA